MIATEKASKVARAAWDDRTQFDKRAMRGWRAGCWAACGLLALSLGGNLMQSSRSHFEMHVVAVDGLGREVGNWPAGKALEITDEMKRSRLRDWIVEARSVTPDPVVTKRYIDGVFATVANGSGAQAFLKEYYSGGASPVMRAATCRVDPQVETVIALSDKSYQIDWVEKTISMSGETQSIERWRAVVTLVVSPAKSSLEVNKLNGLGLYITNLSWSPVMGGKL